MTSDLLTDIGAAHLYTYFRSSLFNNMDKVRLTNQIGSSVQTGDVLVLDTANNESFIAGSDSYPYRPVFVVPEDIDDAGDASTKTIADAEAGWVYRAGAFVPKANVDEAVDAGEYLILSSTDKKFTGTDVTTDDALPPYHAKAIALEAAAGEGQIAVLLLEDAANPYLSCKVYNNEDIEIDASTVTALTFNTEDHDPGGMHEGVTNPSRLTAPSDQVGSMPYKIIGQIEWDDVPLGSYMAIRLNGTTEIARYRGTGEVPLALNLSTVYELSAGDYVELIVYTTSSGKSIKYYSLYSPVFSAIRLGA